MEMNDAQGSALPCGRDIETVWKQPSARAGGEPDGHDPGCEYCAAARESLAVLREVTGELVAEEIQPPAGFATRIMSAVRAERSRHHMLKLPSTEPGEVRVSEQAVAAVLRSAADSVDGVRARHCRITATETDGAVRVRLTIAVGYRGFHADAVEDVRERVRAAASAHVGVSLVHVDLTVEDLYDAPHHRDEAPGL
ncbi:Asp23/Gls24 family envelope stress response protein [Streptomyces sp. NPDC051098]|uniref:Asp23/Gls24 family envelope stress response protein n=1 Tax=Streptomyces sp. NPDC051098 TaxID=3155411 RepID=UPI0034319BC7